MEMETDIGTTPECPDLETTRLEEEEISCYPEERVSCAISLFEFRRGNAPTTIPIGGNSPAQYEGIEVIGVVGTLQGREGLFAQCAWFGDYDLDWFWCRITNIQQVEIRTDVRFRGGEQCAWLKTSYGDYAMILPRVTYVDMWEESLYNAGKEGPSARVQIWPPYGTRPAWWKQHWNDCWPWDKQPQETRLASTRGWKRLGPHGDLRHPGEPLSHLHHLDPWVIVPDSGRRPTQDRSGDA